MGTNLAAVRRARQLTVRQLSERLSALGAPMLPSGITKIETGQRRVDVEELVALSAALNVSPARLLLPDVSEETLVAVTPHLRRPAWSVWQWLEGQYALPADESGETDHEADLALHDLRPSWMRAREQHPLYRAGQHLQWRLRRTLHHVMKDPGSASQAGLELMLARSRDALRGVSDELDRLEEEA